MFYELFWIAPSGDHKINMKIAKESADGREAPVGRLSRMYL